MKGKSIALALALASMAGGVAPTQTAKASTETKQGVNQGKKEKALPNTTAQKHRGSTSVLDAGGDYIPRHGGGSDWENLMNLIHKRTLLNPTTKYKNRRG